MAEKQKTKNEFSYQAYPTTHWWQVWAMALSRPSEATFKFLNDDNNAQKDKIYGQLFWVGTLGALLWTLVLTSNDSRSGIIYFCVIPLGGVYAALWFSITAALMQFVAHLLGGTGSGRDFRYLYAAIYAPLTLVTISLSGFSASPVTLLVNLGLMAYQFGLTAIATKVVNQLSWWRAAAVVGVQVVLNGLILYGLGRLALAFALQARA